MAVLTAQQISSLSVALLTRELVLPQTVSRIPGGEFAGSNGDTITVRVPGTSTAQTQTTRGATITPSDVTETPVNVTLSHLYHAKNVSDEELSLDIENFGAQVTRVQVSAVATGAEDLLAAAMNGLTAELGSVTDVEDAILKARKALTDANVPAGDRYLAVSSDIANMILALDKFSRVDASGNPDGLRNAIIGRAFGLTVVESPALTAGSAVAYHRSGFVFANRVPVTPRGASDSATATAGGIGVRHLFQYNPNTLSDMSVVSTFAGASVVDPARVYKFQTGALV